MMFLIKWILYVFGWPIRIVHTILSYCLAPQISVLLLIVFGLWFVAARCERSSGQEGRACAVCSVCTHACLPKYGADASEGGWAMP